jgi:PEP-CTERM motif-containing protein
MKKLFVRTCLIAVALAGAVATSTPPVYAMGQAPGSATIYGQTGKPISPPGRQRSVPEPSTILLVGAGAAAAFATRKFWRR